VAALLAELSARVACPRGAISVQAELAMRGLRAETGAPRHDIDNASNVSRFVS